jgi:Calcineurin-like phosphoesterase
MIATMTATMIAASIRGQTVEPPRVENASAFCFLIAGHAYGAHDGHNVGLHPPLLAALEAGAFGDIEFIVFTGDVLRRTNPDSSARLEAQLHPLGIPYYIAPGNHDTNEFGRARLRERFGSLYHRFDVGTSRFLVLNTQEVSRTVPPNQLAFLRKALTESAGIEVFFVFMHELLWLSERPEYRSIRANGRSRQSKLKASNYWADVHPLLVQRAPKPVYVIAGDVAGNRDAIPAFHDQIENVTLIASGMGEVKEENACTVTVTDGKPRFDLHPMHVADRMRPLTDYSPAGLNALPADAFVREQGGVWHKVLWALTPVLFVIFVGWLMVNRRRRLGDRTDRGNHPREGPDSARD